MKATRLLPLFGILAIALLVAALAIGGETPDSDAPVAELTSFYTANDSDMTVSSLLLMAAAAAFLAWSIQVRSVLFSSEGAPGTRATLGLVGSVIFAVGMTIFSGLGFALGEAPEKLDPAALQAIHVLSMDLFPPLAVGAVLTLFGNGLAVLKTRAFPAWLGWVSVIGALFAFSPVWFVPFLALGLLIIVSSVMLAMRSEAAATIKTSANGK